MQSADDWYRHSNWSSEIAEHFQQKLKRARKKDEYLRIQAQHLAECYPRDALALLDQFWALEDPFDQPTAWCVTAEAYVALENFDAAISAYERALQEEEQCAIQTDAWLAVPWLLFLTKQTERYAAAIDLLEKTAHRATFPAQRFKLHGLLAILMQHDAPSIALTHAHRAMQYARATHSGFPMHPRLGLLAEGDELDLKAAINDILHPRTRWWHDVLRMFRMSR